MKHHERERSRVQHQTNEEWEEERWTGVKVQPKSTRLVNPVSSSLIYQTHRTTKRGSVALVFDNVETGEEVVAFFNVDIRRQRGSNKGQSYQVGHKGQFLPPERGKFRKFWLESVGKAPSRWSLAFKLMRSAFRGKRFTGDITTQIHPNGEPYLKVTNLRLLEQVRNNSVTTPKRFGNKNWEQTHASATDRPSDPC